MTLIVLGFGGFCGAMRVTNQDRRYLGGLPVCLESLGKCQLPFLWSGLLVKRRAREVV